MSVQTVPSSVRRLDPLQLEWKEKDRRIVVTPADEDRFTLSVAHAIEACRSHVEHKRFEAAFRLLLGELCRWSRERRSRIQKAFLTQGEAGLLFLVVRNAAKFDSDFEDELTELDLKIAQSPLFSGICLSVLSVPQSRDESIATFLHPDLLIAF